MVKKTAKQFVRHCAGGIMALIPNIVIYTIFRYFNAAPEYQTVVPFLLAGQVAFFVHTFWSYRDRAEERSWAGVAWLYCMFMTGQALAATLNYRVAERYEAATPEQDRFNPFVGWLMSWFTDVPHDYWTILSMFYVVPLLAGVSISFSWTNWVSHRKRKDSQ